MINRRVFLILFIFLSAIKFNAQDSLSAKHSIQKPSILSAHVFGIFISRLEANFSKQPIDKISFQIDYQSANVWGQPVENFIANTAELRNKVSVLPWHKRESAVNQNDEDFIKSTDNFKIAYDGVIKSLKANLKIPLDKRNQLGIELRSFMLTDGKFPFSFLTGDDFIEGFHSNIAGGEDPFQRREFGLNQAKISYKDRHDRMMEINKNDVLFGGLQINYTHYLKSFSPFGFNLNFGLHTGFNLSPFNKSIDLGFTANAMRIFDLNDKHFFQLGMGIGYLDLNTASFSDNNIQFATQNYFYNLETAISFNIINRKNQVHSFGADFYWQTSYHNPDEFDYSILIRNELAIRTWHHSASHLYKNNNYWTFFYAFTDKNSFRVYLQQDLRVNNNPDLQTGVGYVLFF